MMGRFFSLKSRIFSLDIKKWREMRRKGRYLKYYIKPVRDDRNSLARNIDFYGPLLAVVLVTWALAAGAAGSLRGTILAALPATVLEVIAAHRLRKALRDGASLHDRLWRSGRQCLESIKAMEGERLETLVVEILEKVDGFADVHALRERDKKGEESLSVIPIRAIFRGAPVAVGCLAPGTGDGKISAEAVLKFKEGLRDTGARAGILVAPGFFSGEAWRAAREGRARVSLVDLYMLVELARENGHSIFPATDGGPIKAGAGPGGYRRLLRVALSGEKAPGYLVSGVIILAMCWLSGAPGAMTPGYMAFGLFNLALSGYCLLSNRQRGLLGRA